jgi:hypothetical protein
VTPAGACVTLNRASSSSALTKIGAVRCCFACSSRHRYSSHCQRSILARYRACKPLRAPYDDHSGSVSIARDPARCACFTKPLCANQLCLAPCLLRRGDCPAFPLTIPSSRRQHARPQERSLPLRQLRLSDIDIEIKGRRSDRVSGDPQEPPQHAQPDERRSLREARLPTEGRRRE